MATAFPEDASRLMASSSEPMSIDAAAPKASLATMPEEIKTMIAKALAERTEKPTLEHYYPRDVQLYQVDKLKHLAQVNREWALVCESLRSQVSLSRKYIRSVQRLTKTWLSPASHPHGFDRQRSRRQLRERGDQVPFDPSRQGRSGLCRRALTRAYSLPQRRPHLSKPVPTGQP